MSGLNERSKRQIALLAGDDLEGLTADEARRSVESCPKCRGHWTRVRGCLDLMERAGKESEPVDGGSLWPALEARLTRPVVLRAERFNGWVPALSMAAACVALLIAGQMEAPPPQDSGEFGFPAGRPIRSPMLSLATARPDRPEPTSRPEDGNVFGSAPESGEFREFSLPYDGPRFVSPFELKP